jgi:hypothetical protein
MSRVRGLISCRQATDAERRGIETQEQFPGGNQMNTAKAIRMFALIAAATAFALTASAQSTSTPPPSSTTPPSAVSAPPSGGTVQSHPTGQEEKQNQQDRIAQGIQSGELTPSEASKLEQQEHNLNSKVETQR